MSDIEVIHAPEHQRYEIRVGEELAGFAEYVVKGERHLFVHTEISQQFEGQSLGSKLAQGALDDMRALDATIVPICPFIAGWIERHPDYDDLVDHKLLARIEARR
jgi:predicted GNAT family acetyltransferase